MQWNKTSRQRGKGAIWCMFGVVAVIVIILWYVEIVPPPEFTPAGDDGRSDTEATVKRVDRLSFYNASDAPVQVRLDLYQEWTPNWNNPGTWVYWPTIDLGTVQPGHFSAKIPLARVTADAVPLLAIKCSVTMGANTQITKIRSESDQTMIVAATFWLGKNKANAHAVCGQIYQENGLLKNHTD